MSMTLAAAIFLAATTTRPAAPASDAPLSGPQAEAVILQIEHETVAAYLKGDAAALEHIWADEYGSFLPDGAVLSKAEYLEGIRSGSIHYDEMEVSDLSVQLFGSFAVVWGRARFKGQGGSQTFNGLDGYLTVYRLRDGRWQAITTHTSRILTGIVM